MARSRVYLVWSGCELRVWAKNRTHGAWVVGEVRLAGSRVVRLEVRARADCPLARLYRGEQACDPADVAQGILDNAEDVPPAEFSCMIRPEEEEDHDPAPPYRVGDGY